MPFLELTICPSYGAAYNSNALSYYGMDKSSYRNYGNYVPSKNGANSDLREIFNSITYDISKVLSRIKIVTSLGVGDVVHIVPFDGSRNTGTIYVATKYHGTFGRCFSIQPTENIVQQGVKILEVKARMAIFLYFGYPGQFMYNTHTKVHYFLYV